MLVSEIQTRVKRQFGDESLVQLTDEDLIRWINDGQRHMVKHNEGLLEVTATSTSTVNVQDYALPANLLILRTVKYQASGEVGYTRLKGMSFSEFEEYMDGWDQATGSTGRPVAYTVFAGQIKVWPIPDQTVANAFKLYYNRVPVDIASGSDTPEIPALYHEGLVKYCLQQAYEMDENWEASGIKAVDLADDLVLLRDRDNGWKKQEMYPSITVRWEDM